MSALQSGHVHEGKAQTTFDRHSYLKLSPRVAQSH